jgi:hypothetical protein
MYKFDLKSGYHHIDIHEHHQHFFGFSWQFGNKTRYFTFSVLPFGLCSRGHIFTFIRSSDIALSTKVECFIRR